MADASGKKRKRDSVGTPSGSTAAVASSGETSFPRGGGGGGRTHHQQGAAAAKKTVAKPFTSDFLFTSSSSAAISGGKDGKEGSKRPKKKKLKRTEGAGTAKKKKKLDADAAGSDEEVDEEAALFGSSIPNKVEALRFKALKEGMSVLGAIKRIKDNSMVVSLPNNLSGVVSIAEVSDVLSEYLAQRVQELEEEEDEESENEGKDTNAKEKVSKTKPLPKLQHYFKVGDLVRCTILSLNPEGKKQVTLSLRPGLFNKDITLPMIHENTVMYGSVKSEEDHGYIVSFETSEFSGFLPKKNVVAADLTNESNHNGSDKTQQNDKKKQKKSSRPVTFKVGQVVECIASSVNRGNKTVILRYDPQAAASLALQEENVQTINSLKAGMRVKTTVKKVLSNGLCLSFLGVFLGTVDKYHVHNFSHSKLSRNWKVGQKIPARILYMDFEAKRVALTTLPHLVTMRPYSFPQGCSVGTVFEEAKVKRVDKGVGILLSLPTEPAQSAFVNVSTASDGHIENLQKHFKIGKVQACRVMGHNYLEGRVIANTQASVLKQRFFRAKDVPAGEVLECVIKAIKADTGDVSVAITDSITAICPNVHLADAPVQKPEKRFKVGAKVKCRVLSNSFSNNSNGKDQKKGQNKGKGKIIVTFKRTLVNSDLPPILSYEDVTPGMSSHGYISSIQNYGCFVTFYNKVTGVVPLGQLTTERHADPMSLFRIGEARKVWVLDSKPKGKKMSLTFIRPPSALDGSSSSSNALLSSAAAAAAQQEDAYSRLHCGQMVSGTVKFFTEQGINIEVEGGLDGLLFNYHLSDHRAHWETLRATFHVGQKVDNLLILEKIAFQRRLVLTMKPSLIRAMEAKKLPSTLSELKPGMVISGVVRNVAHFGCFVGFLNGLTGLAFVTNLMDSFVDNPSEKFVVGQSVQAYVLEVESDKFTLSLKQSLCASQDTSFLQSYFEEQERLYQHTRSTQLATSSQSKDEDEQIWARHTIGSCLDAEVKIVKDYGAVLSLEGGSVTGFAVLDQTKGAEPKEGHVIKGRVLDVDKNGRIVDLSLRPEFVMQPEQQQPSCQQENGGKKSKKKQKKNKKQTDAQQQSKSPYDGLREGQLVDCQVELVKGNYLVLSFNPGQGNQKKSQKEDDDDEATKATATSRQTRVLGFAPTKDLNSQHLDPFNTYRIGQRCKATIQHLPSAEKDQRLLLLLEQEKKEKKTADLYNANADITSISELKPGMGVKCKIVDILESQMNVSLGLHIRGRIHVTEVVDNVDGATHPFEKYKIGDVIDAKVLTVVEKARHRFLPISHKNPVSSRSVDLTIRPSELALPPPQLGPSRPTLQSLAKGQVINGFVHKVTADGLWVHLSTTVRGRVFLLDISNDAAEISSFKEKYRPGMGVQCRVKLVDVEKQRVDLSMSDLVGKSDNIEKGTIRPGRVAAVKPGKGLNIQISAHEFGRAFITDLHDDYPENPLEGFSVGDIVTCYVLSAKHGEDKIDLSLRPSRVERDFALPPELLDYPEVKSFKQIEVGKMMKGYVVNTATNGCFVALNRKVTARIQLSKLSDEYVEEPTKAFPLGKLVTGRIIYIDRNSKKVEMSLRTSILKKNVYFSDLKQGMKVKGFVKRVQSYGIFVRIKHSKLAGLCHKSEVSDDYIKDLAGIYKEGDYVKAYILKLNPQKQQISLSLKPSHFADDEESEDSSGPEDFVEVQQRKKKKKQSAEKKGKKEEEEEEEEEEEKDENSDEEKGEEMMQFEESSSDEESLEIMLNDSKEEEDEQKLEKKKKEKKKKQEEEDEDEDEDDDDEERLDLGSEGLVFEWKDFKLDAESKEGNAADDDKAKMDEEDLDPNSKKNKSRAKKAKRLREEEQVRRMEESMDMEENPPQSTDDFEKLLLASPNSSYLWIRYMAFQLSLSETDKARAIAERALQRIHYREEAERMNVWVALMNLENKFGTHDSLMQVFQRALERNDHKKVHLQLVGIYEREGNRAMAEEVYKTMVRKFKHSSKIWLKFAYFYINNEERQDIGEARKVLQKALQVLPKRKHIMIISKLAQLEFKHGSPERGRTIFESLLSNYPKRVDLWSVYLDMETKAANEEGGNYEKLRNLFERTVSLSLSSKKMKFFFKRYLNFEKAHGTKETVAHVRQLALQYIEAKAAD